MANSGMPVATFILVLVMMMFSLLLVYGVVSWLYKIFRPSRPIGYCLTNLQNGIKDCTRKDYDPGTEVCNMKYSCSHAATPYAMADSGATYTTPPYNKTVVRCSKTPSCADYVSTLTSKTTVSLSNVVLFDLTTYLLEEYVLFLLDSGR